MSERILDTYQNEAMKTAVYPSKGKNIVYAVLGLCDETGEALEKLLDGGDPKELQKEIGDIAWYMAATCEELGASMQELHEDAAVSADTQVQKPYNFQSLVVLHARLAGMVKKSIRDDGGSLTLARLSSMRQTLGSSIYLLASFCEARSWSFRQILDENLAKLRSRQQRNVLKGSGDNR